MRLTILALLLLISCSSPTARQDSCRDYKIYISPQSTVEDIITFLDSNHQLTLVSSQPSEGNVSMVYAEEAHYSPSDSEAFFWVCLNRFNTGKWNIDIQFSEESLENYQLGIAEIRDTYRYLGAEFDDSCQCDIKTYHVQDNIYLEYFQKQGSLDQKLTYHIIIYYE